MEFRVRRAVLSDDRTLHSGAEDVDLDMLQELSLLTIKPFLYMCNADESVLTDAARMAALAAEVAPADSVFLDAKMEQELLELDEESSMELLESIGRTEPGLQALARKGFHTLGWQTNPPGRHRAPGCRGHPHRLGAGVHRGRDRALRRPDGGRVDGGMWWSSALERRQGRSELTPALRAGLTNRNAGGPKFFLGTPCQRSCRTATPRSIRVLPRKPSAPAASPIHSAGPGEMLREQRPSSGDVLAHRRPSRLAVEVAQRGEHGVVIVGRGLRPTRHRGEELSRGIAQRRAEQPADLGARASR
jgi:hypothetical protein